MTDLALNAPGRGWLGRTTGFFDGMARWSAVGLLLGVPTSIALVNISILFLLIGWAFSGRWQRKWAALKASPLTLPVVLLSLWMLLGVTQTREGRFAKLLHQVRIFFGYCLRCEQDIAVYVNAGRAWQHQNIAIDLVLNAITIVGPINLCRFNGLQTLECIGIGMWDDFRRTLFEHF